MSMRRGDTPADTVAALVQALRAEVEAYRAEVAANRAEMTALLQQIAPDIAKLQADMTAVMRRIYDVTSDDSTERWRALARDILADDTEALRRRIRSPLDLPRPEGEPPTESPISEWSPDGVRVVE
jgi:hypothetical protein